MVRRRQDDFILGDKPGTLCRANFHPSLHAFAPLCFKKSVALQAWNLPKTSVIPENPHLAPQKPLLVPTRTLHAPTRTLLVPVRMMRAPTRMMVRVGKSPLALLRKALSVPQTQFIVAWTMLSLTGRTLPPFHVLPSALRFGATSAG